MTRGTPDQPVLDPALDEAVGDESTIWRSADSHALVSPQMMQQRVDQAACFNLISRCQPDGAIRQGNRMIGITIRETLHRFDVSTQLSREGRLSATRNTVGEAVAHSRQRWMFAPDDFVAAPGRIPPPTRFDPRRAQRFVMLNSVFRFDKGHDGFHGFGSGQTIPTSANGRPHVQATAIGTIQRGFGKFAGLQEGTYVYGGTLSPNSAFTGSMMLRVMDQQQTLIARGGLPSIQPTHSQETGVTYLVLRGEAVPTDPVLPNIGPDGKQIGLVVQQGLKLQHIDCAVQAPHGIQTLDQVGRRIGKVTAYVVFDPESAAGTPYAPIPFTAYDEFVIFDRDGKTLATFTADSTEGRVFNLHLAGQPAIRFGGVGRIRNGTGPLAGIRGLMTDNSVVVFAPHVSASVYVLRIDDPDGQFRSVVESG